MFGARGYDSGLRCVCTLRRVANSARFCVYNLSGKEIIHADVVGAVGGAFVGGPSGAAAGAFGASGGESVWQFGNWLWCAYHQ